MFTYLSKLAAEEWDYKNSLHGTIILNVHRDYLKKNFICIYIFFFFKNLCSIFFYHKMGTLFRTSLVDFPPSYLVFQLSFRFLCRCFHLTLHFINFLFHAIFHLSQHHLTHSYLKAIIKSKQ